MTNPKQNESFDDPVCLAIIGKEGESRNCSVVFLIVSRSTTDYLFLVFLRVRELFPCIDNHILLYHILSSATLISSHRY